MGSPIADPAIVPCPHRSSGAQPGARWPRRRGASLGSHLPGVLDGISMVIHMTRREGRRFVEEAAFVKGYDAKENSWDIDQLERVLATS